MISECCSAPLIGESQLCSACKEHANPVPESDEEARENYPVVQEWDCWNTTFCVGEIVLYHGIAHNVIDAGPEQGKRLAMVR